MHSSWVQKLLIRNNLGVLKGNELIFTPLDFVTLSFFIQVYIASKVGLLLPVKFIPTSYSIHTV